MRSSRCCREASKKPIPVTDSSRFFRRCWRQRGTVEGYADNGKTPCCLHSNTSLHLLSMPLYSKHHRRNLYLFHAVQHRPSPDPLSIHFCTAFTHSSSPASSVHAFVAKTRRPARLSRYVLIELNSIGVTGPYFRVVALTTLRPQARYSSSTPPRPTKHFHLTHR